MRYRVNWSYESSLGGPWHAAQLVELDEATATAVDATSPGVLTKAPDGEKRKAVSDADVPADEATDPVQEGATEPALGQRQVTGARNRAKRRAEAHR